MSIYFILTNAGSAYELDATTEITYQESGTVTNNLIETGESVADHYVNNPVQINFSGSISDVKSLSASGPNSRSTESYINDLRQLKTNKQTFSFHFGDKVGSFDNCLFDSLEITQNQSRGNIGEVDSFSIRASIRQVRIAQRARLIPVREAGVTTDNYQEQTKGAGTTEEPTAQEADNFTEGLGRLLQVDLTGG